MKTLEEMPATLLHQAGEEGQLEERSRAPAHEGCKGWEDPHVQLQDGLDVDVFHVGFLVEMIVRRV